MALFAGFLSKWAKKLGEEKPHNKKGSENDKKQHSAVRLKEKRNKNDKLKNGGATPRQSVRPKAGVSSNESALLGTSRGMCGGAFWAYHPRPTPTKYAVRIIAR